MDQHAHIEINFAGRDYRRLARIFKSLVAASIVFLVVLVALVRTVVVFRADTAALDLPIKELALRDADVQSVLAERTRFLGDVSRLSGLLESRRFSWVRLLTSIEAAFPAGAALEHISYNAKDSSLTLEGKADSPEALRNLMVGLEKSPSFKDALLKHQSVEKGIIAFAVGTKYRDTISASRVAAAQ